MLIFQEHSTAHPHHSLQSPRSTLLQQRVAGSISEKLQRTRASRHHCRFWIEGQQLQHHSMLNFRAHSPLEQLSHESFILRSSSLPQFSSTEHSWLLAAFRTSKPDRLVLWSGHLVRPVGTELHCLLLCLVEMLQQQSDDTKQCS